MAITIGSPMRWLADVLYLVCGLIYLPVALYNALILGKNRRGWSQRFGGVPRFDATKRRIWIHAVSLGEVNATPRLCRELRERLPDCEIVISTTTDTGYARAVELYGAACVFRYPLDFSLVVARVLRRVRPSLIVLVELETWYNLVRMATRCGIPVAVVNGRMTERSARRLRLGGRAVRSMFADLAWVGAQDEVIASRFRAAGVCEERIEVTSSLKWDSAAVADKVAGASDMALALGIEGTRPLWVCGSTGPGEEAMLLETYRRLLAEPRGCTNHPSPSMESQSENLNGTPLLALVPRKPERFEEVAQLIERAGFTCIRRSRHGDGLLSEPRASQRFASTFLGVDNAVSEFCEFAFSVSKSLIRPFDAKRWSASGPSVILGDTMGELRKFYSLASVVFVGRSLVPLGGSDPMEVAALGKPMVAGPYTENFREPVELLRAAGGLRVIEGADELPRVIGEMLDRPNMAQESGARARETVLRHQGATQRTADRLVQLLTRDEKHSISASSSRRAGTARDSGEGVTDHGTK